MPLRSRTLLLIPLLLLALVAAGCGGGDDGGDGAGTDGSAEQQPSSLTVYSGRDEELVAPLFDRFTEQTGIELEVRYGDTAELAATIVEEGDNTPADVFFGQDAGALGAMQSADLLAELPAATVDRVDERFRSPEGRWVGTSGRARIIAYDRRELSEDEVPDSVFDLLEPEWRGEVGWAPTNASLQAAVTAMRDVSGQEAAERWLAGMVANDVQAYDSNGDTRDAVANGEVQLALINHYYVLQSIAETGDEDYPVGIKFTEPGDPGSLVNVASAGVLAASENQDAATELIDFLLSDESQAFFVDETQEYPVVPGTASPEGVASLEEIDALDYDLSELSDLEATLRTIEESGAL